MKLACQRQVDDLARWAKEGPYRFDAERANRICKFIELLPHVKGPLLGKPIVLEPWQCFRITTVFGWLKRDTGTRRFRKAYTEVPRGTGKSTEAAGVGMYMLSADGEGGAVVVSAATKRDQAKEIWEPAWFMARKCAGLRNRFGVETSAHAVYIAGEASKFVALGAEDDKLDGLNLHLALVDELHAHRTRGVHDVLETGLGKRPQSLLWEITTAGFNRAGICYEVRTYVTKILDGVIKDESYFGIIYTIDDGDDWTSEEALVKANPNWGVSVDVDIVRSSQRKAMQVASAVNNFLTKHLNVWVSADTAWMDMRAWDACADHSLSLDQFEGQRCYVGLDLATRSDLAVMTLWFPPNEERDWWALFGKYYLPESQSEHESNVNASHYSGWARQGLLTLTPGEITDFDYIIDDICSTSERFEVVEIAGDPNQWLPLINTLNKRGLQMPMVPVQQSIATMSAPMKEFEALVLSRHMRHSGDPVMAWGVSNVVCHTDAKDNIFPRKERPENKIDQPVSAIIGLSRALTNEGPSVYDTRGPIFI